MRKLLPFFLALSAFGQQIPTPFGPVYLASDGTFPAFYLSSATSGALQQQPPSFAVSGYNASTGQWYLCTVANPCTAAIGGGGSMTWPSAPGVTVCTGTPCTAWGTSIDPLTLALGTDSFTNNHVVVGGSGQNVKVDDSLIDSGSVWTMTKGLSAQGPVTSGPDGTHAGLFGVYGNTANPTIPANELGFLGPTSASFTSIFYQLSTTAPIAGQVMAFSAPVANVSTQSWVTPGGGSGSLFSWAGQSTQITAATTVYAPLSGNGTWSVNYYTPWSPLSGCTAKNLYVVTQSAQPASGSLVVTLTYGATASDSIHATTLTVTVAAGSAAGIYSDTTHTPITTVGFLYDVQLVNNATVTDLSAGIAGVMFTCQ